MQTAYDEVPYGNVPFAQALPRVHAMVATLHGLSPADPRTARVLELGCGAGAHLAGIAAAHPEVRAVGIDLAASAIDAARAIAAAAGLENVRFDVGDVLELQGGQLGEFDYVDRARALRVGSRAGARGACSPPVARTSRRDGHRLPVLHGAPGRAPALDAAGDGAVARSRSAGSAERAERARGLFALLDRLGEAGGPSFFTGVVAEDVHTLALSTEEVLVHDLLGPNYAPVWFADFAAAAARHGLTYVGDAIPESSRKPPWSGAVGGVRGRRRGR